MNHFGVPLMFTLFQEKINSVPPVNQKPLLQKYRVKNQEFVYSQIDKLWKYIIDNSEKLNYTNEPLKEDYELETIPELRATYPELSSINNSSLYDLYDDYQDNCNKVKGWDVERDEAFLFYLICDLANFEVQDPNDLVFGEIMGYFLLQDKSIEAAKNLAMEIKKIYSSHKVYFYE